MLYTECGRVMIRRCVDEAPRENYVSLMVLYAVRTGGESG